MSKDNLRNNMTRKKEKEEVHTTAGIKKLRRRQGGLERILRELRVRSLKREQNMENRRDRVRGYFDIKAHRTIKGGKEQTLSLVRIVMRGRAGNFWRP